MHELLIDRTLVLVAGEAKLPDLNDEDPCIDFVAADSKMNVLELIEDELILSLPLAPKHGFECANDGGGNDTGASSPFEKLRKPS